MASECIAIALSPENNFVMGKTFVTHFGASGNVSTVIRRRVSAGSDAIDVQRTCRVCTPDEWISYWLCLMDGKVYAGVGSIPGQGTIVILDDTLNYTSIPKTDNVRFVGIGNSALGKASRSLKIRNIVVANVPDNLSFHLSSLDDNELSFIDVETSTNDEAKVIFEAYQMECRKVKLRAKKFDVPYQEPNWKKFLESSNARKLRLNTPKGFATGLDLQSPEEQEKQRKRAERFGLQEMQSNQDGIDEETMDDVDSPIDDSPDNDQNVNSTKPWDNELKTQKYRIDPPKELWKIPLGEDIDEPILDSAMEDFELITIIEEKIHVFGIDLAAFLKIRSDDIMSYFSVYGPSHVEWLGDYSCNVHFEDKYSAARALQGLSKPIVSPPPQDLIVSRQLNNSSPPPDLGRMGWYFCPMPIRKVSNDRFGRKGIRARIILRLATSADVGIENKEEEEQQQEDKNFPRQQRPRQQQRRQSLQSRAQRKFSSKRALSSEQLVTSSNDNFQGSEGSRRRRHPQRKRRKISSRKEEREESNTYPGIKNPLLVNQALKSTRDGFSMDEIKTERIDS
jgi:Nuclear cap-binding protein subunit 3